MFRTRLSTGVKNRTKSEFRKRDIDLDVSLKTRKGRSAAPVLDVFEVNQNIELLDLMDRQSKEIEATLKRKYGQIRPIQLLMTIPGIGFVSALTLYAEICDFKRFSNPEKLAHYAGLVPRIRQSGEHSYMEALMAVERGFKAGKLELTCTNPPTLGPLKRFVNHKSIRGSLMLDG